MAWSVPGASQLLHMIPESISDASILHIHYLLLFTTYYFLKTDLLFSSFYIYFLSILCLLNSLFISISFKYPCKVSFSPTCNTQYPFNISHLHISHIPTISHNIPSISPNISSMSHKIPFNISHIIIQYISHNIPFNISQYFTNIPSTSHKYSFNISQIFLQYFIQYFSISHKYSFNISKLHIFHNFPSISHHFIYSISSNISPIPYIQYLTNYMYSISTQYLTRFIFSISIEYFTHFIIISNILQFQSTICLFSFF